MDATNAKIFGKNVWKIMDFSVVQLLSKLCEKRLEFLPEDPLLGIPHKLFSNLINYIKIYIVRESIQNWIFLYKKN